MHFFKCSNGATSKWRKKNVIKTAEVPYKNSVINVFDFEDLFTLRKKLFKETENLKRKVLMFYNIKGGCTKTTTSSQLIFLWSLMGYKILAIDLDNQQDLTCALGTNPELVKYSVFNILEGSCSIDEAIIPLNHNIHLLPANEDMDDMESELMKELRRELFLKKLVGKVKDNYDIIILDSHPVKNILNTAGIYAADGIIIPAQCDYFGYRGVVRTMNHIKDLPKKDFKEDYSKRVKIIPNRFNLLRKTDKTYLDGLYSDFPGMITQRVRESAIFAKASDLSLSIFNLKKQFNKTLDPEELEQRINEGLLVGLDTKHSACEDLQRLADELIEYMKGN